jgi:hypothetical protein
MKRKTARTRASVFSLFVVRISSTSTCAVMGHLQLGYLTFAI